MVPSTKRRSISSKLSNDHGKLILKSEKKEKPDEYKDQLYTKSETHLEDQIKFYQGSSDNIIKQSSGQRLHLLSCSTRNRDDGSKAVRQRKTHLSFSDTHRKSLNHIAVNCYPILEIGGDLSQTSNFNCMNISSSSSSVSELISTFKGKLIFPILCLDNLIIPYSKVEYLDQDSFVMEILNYKPLEEGKQRIMQNKLNNNIQLLQASTESHTCLSDGIGGEESLKKNKTFLSQEETFYRFNRKGWICAICSNFNFESK